MAKKLKSFQNLVPYKVRNKVDLTSLEFVKTDLLPVVQVKVNDEEAFFLIDTGAGETVLDSKFAEKVGAISFGPEIGTYARGRKSTYQHGRLNSLSLGNLTLENIPIHIHNVSQYSKLLFRGLEINGIIGTMLFYHFITTIDYPDGKLVLQRKQRKI